jgi:hypothetical protein
MERKGAIDLRCICQIAHQSGVDATAEFQLSTFAEDFTFAADTAVWTDLPPTASVTTTTTTTAMLVLSEALIFILLAIRNWLLNGSLPFGVSLERLNDHAWNDA